MSQRKIRKSFDIDQAALRRVDQLASKLGISTAAYIRQAIDEKNDRTFATEQINRALEGLDGRLDLLEKLHEQSLLTLVDEIGGVKQYVNQCARGGVELLSKHNGEIAVGVVSEIDALLTNKLAEAFPEPVGEALVFLVERHQRKLKEAKRGPTSRPPSQR